METQIIVVILIYIGSFSLIAWAIWFTRKMDREFKERREVMYERMEKVVSDYKNHVNR